MKKFLLVAMLIATLAVIAGCTSPTPIVAPTPVPAATKPAASSSSAASSAVTIGTIKGTLTLWHGYHTGGSEEQALNQLLDGIKKANPDLKLTVLAVPFDQLFNKFETEAAAGGGPDLWTAPNDNLGNEVRANLLKPIDDLLKGKLDKYSKLSIDGVTVDGKMYAVPMIVKAVALYYNKSKIPTPPKTTADLLALLKSGKTIAINENNYHNYGFFPAFGGTLMDAKGACVADQNSGFADAMQYLLDLKAAGAKFETDGGKADTEFRQGQVDMIINGPWVLGDYKGDLKDNLGVVPMPAGPKGPSLPLSGIDGWYVNANTKNADAAVALGLALTTPEAQKLYADLAGDPAVRTDVSVADPLVKAFADAGAAGFPRPQSAAFGNWWGPFGDMVTKVIEGKATPKDGVAQACSDMNKANKITVAPASSSASSVASSSASSASSAASSAALKCDHTIKIGLIGDYSGPLASYGTWQRRSFLLGLEYLAGAPATNGVFKIGDCQMQVIDKDDKSDPTTSATVARQLIEVEKVDVLVGSVSSAATATLQGLAKDNKKVLIVAPAAANDITGKDFNEYTFRVSRNNYQDAINLCQYLTTKYKKFVQIAPDYSFGYGGAASFRDACTKFGATFVMDDIFAPQDTKEFTPYLDKIAKSGADVWIVTWAGAGFVPMFKTAREMGIFDKIALGASVADNATVPLYVDAMGQYSGILYHYTLPKNPINDWLVKEVLARFKSPPDLFDADGMNAALMLVAGLKKTNGSTDSTALIKAFEGLEFDGPKGHVAIRPEDHVAIQDMYVVKILNVTDKDFKFFELGGTTRPEPPCLLPDALKSRCGKLPVGSLSGK